MCIIDFLLSVFKAAIKPKVVVALFFALYVQGFPLPKKV